MLHTFRKREQQNHSFILLFRCFIHNHSLNIKEDRGLVKSNKNSSDYLPYNLIEIFRNIFSFFCIHILVSTERLFSLYYNIQHIVMILYLILGLISIGIRNNLSMSNEQQEEEKKTEKHLKKCEITELLSSVHDYVFFIHFILRRWLSALNNLNSKLYDANYLLFLISTKRFVISSIVFFKFAFFSLLFFSILFIKWADGDIRYNIGNINDQMIFDCILFLLARVFIHVEHHWRSFFFLLFMAKCP